MPPLEHEAHWPQACSPARPHLGTAKHVLKPVSTPGLGLGHMCPAASVCPLPPARVPSSLQSTVQGRAPHSPVLG